MKPEPMSDEQIDGIAQHYSLPCSAYSFVQAAIAVRDKQWKEMLEKQESAITDECGRPMTYWGGNPLYLAAGAKEQQA